MTSPQALGQALGTYNPLYTPAANASMQSISQQQQLGQALLNEGLTPLDPNRQIGGVGYRISPLEGLAKLAQVLSGRSDIDNANQQLSQLYGGTQSGGQPSQDTADAAMNAQANVPGAQAGPTQAAANAAQSSGGLPPIYSDAGMAIANQGTKMGLSPGQSLGLYMSDPTAWAKLYGEFNAPTNEQKNIGDAAQVRQLATAGMQAAAQKNIGANEMGFNYATGQTIVPGTNPQFVQGQAALEGDKAMQTGLGQAAAQNAPAGTLPAGMPPGTNPMLPALQQAESGGNPNALSSKGAAGAFQIMPATAANPGYGVKPLQGWDGKDPRTAPIAEQQRFSNDLLNAYQKAVGGDSAMAAAAYNAGPGAVQSAQKAAGGNNAQAMQMMPIGTQQYSAQVAGGPPSPNGLTNAQYAAANEAYKAGQVAQAQVAGEAAKTDATDTAKNLADSQKTLSVMTSNLPQALDRFAQMQQYAKDASSGLMAKTGLGDDIAQAGFGAPSATAVANARLEQLAAQGILPELGPALAQAGVKGNKFLEGLANSASGLEMVDKPAVKAQVINGLQSQYIKNLASTNQNVSQLGGKPLDLSQYNIFSSPDDPGFQSLPKGSQFFDATTGERRIKH